MRIAHNLSIDHFRKEKKHPKITLNNGNDIFNSLAFSENNSESKQENKEYNLLSRRSSTQVTCRFAKISKIELQDWLLVLQSFALEAQQRSK